ncbi:phosphatidate cytidylyltransferase [Candidatus Saccharibacteria bacterium]|nr:phosphatidate cytidylyltransferase [Candidatus Saccharibacteria bacterium]
MCYNWDMDKNLRMRLIVGFGLFFVALVALYTFDAIPFKVIFGVFSFVATIELLSFFKRKHGILNIVLAVMEMAFLACGTIFVAKIDPSHFWYIILGVCGYDIFAYAFGKICGGKIFKKSRPFPYISKNKTWEGTILGLASSIGMVVIMMAVRGTFATEWMYLLCGPLALMGDLFESYLKRKFNVKDSNEIIIKNKFFEKVELLVGGTEGHGGYLDRIDSTAFTTTVLLVISLFI